MTAIADLTAREIRDSHGRSTVEAEPELANGMRVRASVPSGAFTGRHEALELRDGDPVRHAGRGVKSAAANVGGALADAVVGLDIAEQSTVDTAPLQADGTADKSALGANAVLASGGRARRRRRRPALALPPGRPAADHAETDHQLDQRCLRARRNLDVQDFLIVPVSAKTLPQALEDAAAVIASTAELLTERDRSTLHADEGGFGPALDGHRDAFELAPTAVEAAGLALGTDIAFAVDLAASHFYDPHGATYQLQAERRTTDAAGMIDMVESWAA